MQITNQQLFDNAVIGIRNQEYRVAVDSSGCTILASNGDRCALGHSCTDVKYPGDASWEWVLLNKTLVGNRLRAAHDRALKHFGKAAWLVVMREIAREFDLNTIELDKCS